MILNDICVSFEVIENMTVQQVQELEQQFIIKKEVQQNETTINPNGQY